MTVSNSGLVSFFMAGDTGYTSANMEITEPAGGGTAVVGYGHAVYAYRPPDYRYPPVVFTGWADASKSSGQHISLFSGDDVIELSGRAKKHHVRGDPDLEYLSGISDDDTYYGGYHGKQDRREA